MTGEICDGDRGIPPEPDIRNHVDVEDDFRWFEIGAPDYPEIEPPRSFTEGDKLWQFAVGEEEDPFA